MATFSPSCASKTLHPAQAAPGEAQGSAGIAGGMARRGERPQELGPEVSASKRRRLS